MNQIIKDTTENFFQELAAHAAAEAAVRAQQGRV